MKFSSILCLIGCWILGGCSGVKLPPDICRSLDKAVGYIEEFKASHTRLPSRDEYRSWWKTNDLVGVVDYQIEPPQGSGEYTLYVWLGERMVRYSSITKSVSAP